MSPRHPIRALLASILALSLLAAACGDDSTDAAQPVDSDDAATTNDEPEPEAETEPEPEPAMESESEPELEEEAEPGPEPMLEGELVGLFSIDATDCAVAGSETGSYFRMVAIGGTVEGGPFVPNGDSDCADQTFIVMSPGTDGGLLTGTLQPGSEPLFDAAGNATADRIAAPTTFFGVAFGLATTDEADPPLIIAIEGDLSGNTASVSAYYAGEIFNQGSPKPDGSTPGITWPSPIGTIDPDTGTYTLDWASQIVGGAFNDFTGVWHLEGTFTPST